MKKKLITLVILLALFSAKVTIAQSYIPMAVDSVRWIVQYDDIQTPWLDDALWEYYCLGDTLVNGAEYKKVYKRNLEPTHSGPPFRAISPYILAALMRDDAEIRKVYAIVLQYGVSDCPVGEEALLYDFTLNTGDTANHLCVIPEMDACGEVIVEETGNSSFYGINTRYFQVSGACTSGYYFEGIGSDHGLFELMFTPVKSRYVSQASLEYYCRTADCPFIVSTNEKPVPSNFSVYPNPANEKINVQLPFNVPPSTTKVEVYSADGRLVHKAIPGNNPYVFNSESLVSGIYLIRMWDGKVWQSGKVIRE